MRQNTRQHIYSSWNAYDISTKGAGPLLNIDNINMKDIKNFSLLFLSVFFSCCSSGIQVNEGLERVYEEAKSAFPESSTCFLPDLKAGKLLLFEVSLPDEGHGKTPSYIHLLMMYSREKMDSILRIAYGASITYSFNDPYLLILDYDPDKIQHFQNLKAMKDTLDINPIPNFDFLQNGMWGSKYQSEATIYNLSWTQGVNLDKKKLRVDRAGLPANWEHGSTAGVTIWDNYVAYWLDVW